MSPDTRHEIARKKVVYHIPGADAVTVRRDDVYRVTDAGPLTMDLYYPPASTTGARLPAIVVVVGYSGARTPSPLGCAFKEMEWSISWGRLVAASGMVAIFYTNREPETDLQALLHHVRQNAASLGIDENRIGVFATSGHVPLALSLLTQDARDYLKCAVLCYGYMLDLDGTTGVADAARQWGFINPAAGKSVADLPRDVPLFIARAGQDQMPHLNDALDGFVAKAVACNLPMTFVNHHVAPHAFDLLHDSETTREIIRQLLAFMRFNLGAQQETPSPRPRSRGAG